jgi:hypothetical protein
VDKSTITDALCVCLNQTVRDNLASELRNSRPEWTQKIRRALTDAARGLGLRVAPSGEEGSFLYDMVWYSVDKNEIFLKQHLVCEFEYNIAPPNFVDVDFEKLVQARADVRLWISTSANKTDSLRHIENCKRQICVFEGSQLADRYIMLLFEWEPIKSHTFEVYDYMG